MYIDLSVPITENTPVYPGDPRTVIRPAGVLAKDGYCDHYVSMGTHVGTHIDAPMHMLEHGTTLGQIPVSHFIGTGRYIKITGNDFGSVKNANIQADDIVLFHTGLADKYDHPEYFENYPAMSAEVAAYLVASKVKMVGVDTCSIDNQDGFPIHKLLLAGDVLIIENLTNLDQLEGKSFIVYALPLNLQIDAAPARVIAETMP